MAGAVPTDTSRCDVVFRGCSGPFAYTLKFKFGLAVCEALKKRPGGVPINQ